MSTIQTAQVEDYTPYLQQLSEGKKKRKKAALEQAYQNSLAAITRAEEGLDGTYRNAANTAAGTAAVGQRNFEQYAAASGLGSGAAGQARLAKTVALQNDLNKLSAQKAQDKSDLALQKTAAGQEYESGLADAEAEAEQSLAQALYDEQVRQAQARYQAQRDAVEDSRWQSQQDYQASRDAVKDAQWQKEFDYQASRDTAQDAQWQSQQDYTASRDAVKDAQWQKEFGYQASRDAVEDSRWQSQQDYTASRDAVKDSQWQKELEFAIQKYWYDNGYLTPPTASDNTGASGTSNADLQSVAMQVIRGEWGNGAERKQRLTAAGYDYNAVQSIVDTMLPGRPAAILRPRPTTK